MALRWTSAEPMFIPQNGLYSAMPYIVSFVVTISGSILADFIISKNVLSITHVRKLFQSMGKYVLICPENKVMSSSSFFVFLFCFVCFPQCLKCTRGNVKNIFLKVNNVPTQFGIYPGNIMEQYQG